MEVEWTATPEQRQTVDRLAAAYEGGVLVRALPDGSLEVLTRRRGALGRHSVDTHGSSMLVESRPTGWRHRGGPLVWCLAFAAFIGSLITIGVQDGPTTSASWWAVALMVIGFLGLLVGWALMPGPHQLTRRGERWAKVGFPEE